MNTTNSARAWAGIVTYTLRHRHAAVEASDWQRRAAWSAQRVRELGALLDRERSAGRLWHGEYRAAEDAAVAMREVAVSANARALAEAADADEARAACTELMDERDAHARNADSALSVTRSAIRDRDAWRAEAGRTTRAARQAADEAAHLADVTASLTAERDELSAAVLDERRARREAEANLDAAEDEASARADTIADLEPRLFAVAEERDDALTAGNALRDRLAEAEEEIRRLAEERDTAERLLAEARGYRPDRGRVVVNVVPAPPALTTLYAPVRVPCRRCGG